MSQQGFIPWQCIELKEKSEFKRLLFFVKTQLNQNSQYLSFQ